MLFSDLEILLERLFYLDSDHVLIFVGSRRGGDDDWLFLLATYNLSWCEEPSAVEFARILAMVSSTCPLASL
ncbi:unnamed protein product [Brassica oleracea var. botrytis]